MGKIERSCVAEAEAIRSSGPRRSRCRPIRHTAYYEHATYRIPHATRHYPEVFGKCY
jgi:hypothetical protein